MTYSSAKTPLICVLYVLGEFAAGLIAPVVFGRILWSVVAEHFALASIVTGIAAVAWAHFECAKRGVRLPPVFGWGLFGLPLLFVPLFLFKTRDWWRAALTLLVSVGIAMVGGSAFAVGLWIATSGQV
jgi:hypothetical protein